MGFVKDVSNRSQELRQNVRQFHEATDGEWILLRERHLPHFASCGVRGNTLGPNDGCQQNSPGAEDRDGERDHCEYLLDGHG